MKIHFKQLEELDIQKGQKICIFGAGKAGSLIFVYLWNNGCKNIFIADNNKEKHREIKSECFVGAVSEAVEFNPDVFIIAFLGNDEEKLLSAAADLKCAGATESKIIFVYLSDRIICEYSAMFAKKYYESINFIGVNGEKPYRVVLVGTWYTENSIKTPGGGTNGAVNMQRILLGESIGNLKVEYMIFPEMKEVPFEWKFSRYAFHLNTVKYIEKDARRGGAIYISNDVFSSCVLGLLGQKYICIYHGQGDYVSDCNAFGWNLSEKGVDFITWIEKIGMENAYKTYFSACVIH